MSEFLITPVVFEDICYFSYQKRNGQFLSLATKDKRKGCTRKLLITLKYPFQPNMLCFFSDEKNFCQDQIVNSQDNCRIALSPQNVLTLMKTKHPVHIMVLGVFIIDSDVMPPFSPHIVPESTQRATSSAWIKRVEAGRLYFWQQDTEPCHTSRKTQPKLRTFFQPRHP